MSQSNAQVMLYKMATEPKLRRVLRKQADGELTDAVSQWFSNPENLKNLGVGAGLGLGSYMLTGAIPGLRKKKALRLLLSLGIGGLSGYFGTDIRNTVSGWFGAGTPAAASDQSTSNQETPTSEAGYTPTQGANAFGADIWNSLESPQNKQKSEKRSTWPDDNPLNIDNQTINKQRRSMTSSTNLV